MYESLYKFLGKHEILNSLQFGFRAKHYISHALIILTETIKLSLDNRRLACEIFHGLQKDFNTVNHDILIMKLEQYGIRGIASDCLNPTTRTESSMFQLMDSTLASSVLPLFHKARYWAPSCF